jgi:hypothetical protein
MLFNPKHADRLARSAERIRLAPAVTPELMSAVTGRACARLTVLQGRMGARIHGLIASSAWTDAALALIALELPQWRLRRLLYADGDWVCCLSREPNLPDALDDTVDARHMVMPLAILQACVEALRRTDAVRDIPSPTTPCPTPTRQVLSCENYA